jgi:hypothetical protein
VKLMEKRDARNVPSSAFSKQNVSSISDLLSHLLFSYLSFIPSLGWRHRWRSSTMFSPPEAVSGAEQDPGHSSLSPGDTITGGADPASAPWDASTP